MQAIRRRKSNLAWRFRKITEIDSGAKTEVPMFKGNRRYYAAGVEASCSLLEGDFKGDAMSPLYRCHDSYDRAQLGVKLTS